MSLVSIIVPVYNVEPYIETCIQSLIRQTMGNIEVILVDDGSTDRSGELCDQYAEADERIRQMWLSLTIRKSNCAAEENKQEHLHCLPGRSSMQRVFHSFC